jgi:CIC family chloride channel protein|tara:strand:+ start:574 stop:2274 length:1701 start_codon:yes stop_codon:yes gene_type:complete
MFFSILTTLVLGSLIGIITSISVYGFISLVKFLTNVFRNPERSFNSFNDILTNTPEFVIFIFVMPFLVGLIVGCIRKYASDSRWHGPPDVILAAHSENNPLDIKSGFLTSFSSILSISAGGSVGQYGPLVHFGATIGAEINDLFRNKASYEILIGAGVASAISAGFGAPLAGLIFAREVILRHQSLASFAPILVASVVSYLFTKNIFGMDPIFLGSVGEINSLYDFPFFILAGIICGFISIIYMNGLTHPKYFPDISFINPILQPAIAGLMCGITSIFLPEVIGLGTGAIQSMILGNVEFIYAFYFLIFKLLLTVLCLRMGLIGGVFAPALFLGASVGVILGFIFQNFSTTLDLNLLTVASMSAFASCVIGGPVANMMIILELTSDYQATLVAGVSIVFASLISYKVIGQSVFDKVLSNKNIDLKVGRENIKLQQIAVSTICHKDFCTLKPDFTIEKSINLMVKLKKSEGYLIDSDEKLLNKFELHQLISEKNKNKKISKLHQFKFLKLYSESNIFESIEKSKDFVGESIPIVTKQNKMFGIISEGDLFQIFLKVTREEKELENKD